ncbi:guanylate kinase [Blastococcus sp. Marseille-P5729]|uniref:guanylate kinase n=1 Tax=Blastococcus sp. Marseille-P5729 TaxID=2086582 RepID=UPI000D0FD05F|nr:guanylate kinase [Blastococcus sp. Marseille-P5729]
MSQSSPGRLVVLSGPSGVGKGSVMARLRQREMPVWVSVSCTTRAPRPGERDGEHYFFIDEAEFVRRVEAGEMLEHAQFAGRRYGTPRAAVQQHLDAGESVLLEIELDGARQVKASMPEAFMVFLAPPSRDELVRRLTGRGTETPEQIAARLAQAEVELAAEREFDEVIVTADLGGAVGRLLDLITGPRPGAGERAPREPDLNGAAPENSPQR